MRFREDKAANLERARAAVAEWREQHPAGTVRLLLFEAGLNLRLSACSACYGSGAGGRETVEDDGEQSRPRLLIEACAAQLGELFAALRRRPPSPPGQTRQPDSQRPGRPRSRIKIPGQNSGETRAPPAGGRP
jgi:hypothetical protein